MRPLKAAALALLTMATFTSVCGAAQPSATPADSLLVRVDWQEPPMLPARFRNHCSIDKFSGRPYCANHCGSGYQFYACSSASFGCCRLGHGYCDWEGHLRCTPW